MTNNEIIENLLKNFTVGISVIPVSFLKYEGNSNTYIVYQEIDSYGNLYADDTVQSITHVYDFTIYSTSNFLLIMEKLKSTLETDDRFTWSSDSPDMFDDETGIFYKTTTFNLERSF